MPVASTRPSSPHVRIRRRRHRARPFALGLLALAALATLPACSPTPPAAASVDAHPAVSPLPPALVAALDDFRAEGPKGWAFTQTSKRGESTRVERFDPRQRGQARWTLLSDDGKTPTEEEQTRYRDTRPLFDAAANLAAQLDRGSATLAAEDERTTTYQFRLVPGSEKDVAAEHMRARLTLDRPTGAIVHVELFSVRPFKPAVSLSIDEARTTIDYSPPTAELPALPQKVTMHVRGHRIWVKQFEEKVVTTYSEHEKVAAAPAATEPTAPAE